MSVGKKMKSRQKSKIGRRKNDVEGYARPGVSLGESGEEVGHERSSDTECYFHFPLGRLELEKGNPKSIKENFL